MTDTPKHIKELQLKLWLVKTPEERLLQFLTDNDILFQGILALKKDRQKNLVEKNGRDTENIIKKAT
jgi:hypothetical protein